MERFKRRHHKQKYARERTCWRERTYYNKCQFTCKGRELEKLPLSIINIYTQEMSLSKI